MVAHVANTPAMRSSTKSRRRSKKSRRSTFCPKQVDLSWRTRGEMYPKRISKRMLITCCFISLDVIVAWYYNQTILALSVMLMVMTSINYWRKPVLGLRRNMDIATVIAVTCLHLYQSATVLDDHDVFEYWIRFGVGIFIYGLSKYCKVNGELELDSYLHCIMHCWGTINNIWLYWNLYLKQQESH